MDEALALPTEQSARLALRTQQVVAYESGVADTVDPLAGSYAVEHLTSEVERLALDYIQKIDAMGGMLHAIELGYVQREIQEAAYQYQRAVESDKAVVVGVNRFRSDAETPVPTLRIDPSVERAQVERLRHLRASRDAERTEVALTLLEDAARSTDNLLPHILRCVESLATVGEISHRLRRVWGEYREAVTV
jgi:methylmalonyl-CoA mutase N-terminal domain/subunit